MSARFTATVRNGRLVIDDGVDLPEGARFELVALAEDDALGSGERERLHATLRASWESAQHGETRSVNELVRELKERRAGSHQGLKSGLLTKF